MPEQIGMNPSQGLPKRMDENPAKKVELSQEKSENDFTIEEKESFYQSILEQINFDEAFVSKLDSVPFTLHTYIVNRLIDEGFVDKVRYFLSHFRELHQDITNRLFDCEEASQIAKNLENFKGLNHQDIANRLIDNGYYLEVAQNLGKFQGLNHQDIANRLIDIGQGFFVANNLENFQGLDQSIAIHLIDDKKGKLVAEKLDKFQGLNHQEIANRLIGSGQSEAVFCHLDNFKGLDQDMAIRLIDSLPHASSWVVDALDRFQAINHQDIANHLIDIGDGQTVAEKFDRFQDINHQEIANRLIDIGKRRFSVKNLNSFLNLTVQGLRSSSCVDAFLVSLDTLIPDASQRMTVETLLEVMDSPKTSEKILEGIRENPFLSGAFLASKYGMKLILKYPELDQKSREDITFLYDAQLSKGNIESATPEFRALIQEKLRTYKNNPDIAAALQEKGVDIEMWLNYDHQDIFDLGKEDEISFAERVHLPITRLIETQTKYIESVRVALHSYRLQLLTLSVTESVESFVQDVAKMRREEEKTQDLLDQEKELAQSENAIQKLEKKLKGLSMGIESLEQRIGNPKSVPAWERIIGGVSSLKKVMDFVAISAEELAKHDQMVQSLQNTPSLESRKKLIEIKVRGLALKRKFREDLALLDIRLKSFELNQELLFEQLLGKESKDAYMNSFHSLILEDRDHMNADFSTLQRLIEDEAKENEYSLSDTPMSISLWNRNPDEDLYLGNYTDCCIRIDSGHMGAESTIADYMTDLGMQVVTVRDEKKDIPVMAAWSFIGKNRTTGEVAFVIDNIEANTDYSIAFQSQLSKKLKAYIEKYAQSIGVPKIVQGQLNNDMTLFGMDGKYVKLGGYNRNGGYYLEGE